MKKVVEKFGFAVIILLMAAALLTFMTPHLGWSVDAVYSGSMEPKLNVGGLVITRPVETADIQAGDIITYSSPTDAKMVSHRVVEIEEHDTLLFQTKGDANEEADLFSVPSQNVVGKVCFHLPYFGYVAQFVKSRLGLVLLLLIPGSIIILMETRNIWRVLAEQKIERKYRIG